jgi:hypothetical protein
MINLRIDRARWEERRRHDIELVGVEECLDMFIAAPPAPPSLAEG